jgi:hypothetical protein
VAPPSRPPTTASTSDGGPLEGARHLNRVAVGRAEYDVYLPEGEGQAVAVVPSVTEGVPDRLVPFTGYLVPMAINIKEANGIIATPDGGNVIAGRCRWQITANGAVIYSPAQSSFSAREALMEACGAFQALIKQMSQDQVRWWDQGNWRGRVVRYQGVDAVVFSADPLKGQMLLIPRSPAEDFPLTRTEALGGLEPSTRPGGALWVDILDQNVWWTTEQIRVEDQRTRARTNVPVSAQADTADVESPHGPEEPEETAVAESNAQSAPAGETEAQAAGLEAAPSPAADPQEEEDDGERSSEPTEATA